MNFRAFYIVLTCGIILLVWLQTTPDARPFKEDNISLRSGLDRLPAKDIATLKVNHARRTGPVDIGVFGNSRSIQISRVNIRRIEDSFFNYSVPGSSFRQSVTILEELADTQRLPRQIVISMDNLNLQYYANPSFPGIFGRWPRAFNDISYGFQAPDISLLALARMVRRHILIEWASFTNIFNTNILKERVNLISSANDSNQTIRYRVDGSRAMKRIAQPLIKKKYPAVKANIITGYLTYDLARLAKINSMGSNIVIYESPLFPNMKGKENKAAIELRKHFLKTCKALLLNCYPAPILANNRNWGDISHAPATLLGPWVSNLITRNGENSK